MDDSERNFEQKKQANPSQDCVDKKKTKDKMIR